MKPRLPRLLAAATFGLLLAAGAPATESPTRDWAPSTIELSARQVAPHTWFVEGRLEEASRENEGFIANAGFVVTGAGVVVFDALGSPALGDALIAAIRKQTDEPIRLLVVSHYHADHFYGIPAFRRIGAEVVADARAREYLNSEAAEQRLAQRRGIIGPQLGKSFTLPLPDRWIEKNETFHMGGIDFALHRLGPAHSPDDLAMLVEPDGVLFSGDIVYAGRVPFIGEAKTRTWLVAIDRLLALPAKIMLPGHGPASTNPRADAELTRDYLGFLREQMGRAVADFSDFDEAYARTDWSRFARVPTFDAANRQNAYSVYLEMEQESLGK